MKIIILAAGIGERLYPLTRNTPKPLIDMGNGKTLLEEQIDRIQASGVIDEIILVIGYLAEQIEAKLQYYQNLGIRIKTVYNPFYDISNNLISLWFAKEEMTESFLVTNGVNMFSTQVFQQFVSENANGIFLCVCRKDKYEADDMKVSFQNDLVEYVSKNIAPDRVDAESPGLFLVSGSKMIATVKHELEGLVRKAESRNSFWLELPNHLARKGIPVEPWEFDCEENWQEVDIHLDIDKVKKLIGIHR